MPTSTTRMWPNVRPIVAVVAVLAVAVITLLPSTTAADVMIADDGSLDADEIWRHLRADRRQQPQRVRRAENPLDSLAWLNLRRYVCGGDANVQCLTDERFDQLQPEFLQRISQRIDGVQQLRAPPTVLPTLPVHQFATIPMMVDESDAILLPAADEHPDDVSIWNSLNLSGRREFPFYVDEPDYVTTMEERAVPLRLYGERKHYLNDPFIPQRGRRRAPHSSIANIAERFDLVSQSRPAAVAAADEYRLKREAWTFWPLTTHKFRSKRAQRTVDDDTTRDGGQQRMPALSSPSPSPSPSSSLSGDTDRVADSGTAAEAAAAAAALGNVLQPFVPRNLSPATGPTTIAAATPLTSAAVAKPATTSGDSGSRSDATDRDTFYLARGSRIHQPQHWQRHNTSQQ